MATHEQGVGYGVPPAHDSLSRSNQLRFAGFCFEASILQLFEDALHMLLDVPGFRSTRRASINSARSAALTSQGDFCPPKRNTGHGSILPVARRRASS